MLEVAFGNNRKAVVICFLLKLLVFVRSKFHHRV